MPLVIRATAKVVKGIQPVYLHKATGGLQHGSNLISLYADPVSASPALRGRRQPSYCCGRNAGVWLTKSFLANSIWKLRWCQERAKKSSGLLNQSIHHKQLENPCQAIALLQVGRNPLPHVPFTHAQRTTHALSVTKDSSTILPTAASVRAKCCAEQAFLVKERLNFQKLLWNHRVNGFRLRTGNTF